MALWWLLRAGVAAVGLVGVPFACGVGRTFGGFGGFGGFEAWQTADLNAYKKPLLRPGGALQPLLWPCGGFCVREWRVLGLLGYLFLAELGGLGVPFSPCCGLVVAFACGSGACWACWGTFSRRSWADFWRVWSV